MALVCASLTLGLLARSVALLPQDRLAQQRDLARNEKALLCVPARGWPPVLAAVALGLQLTFWEHATAGSGEMLELLLFAGVIWCILEHRCDPPVVLAELCVLLVRRRPGEQLGYGRLCAAWLRWR